MEAKLQISYGGFPVAKIDFIIFLARFACIMTNHGRLILESKRTALLRKNVTSADSPMRF